MRRVLCILICLCMASMASALSITNGDFELQTIATYDRDIAEWYDYGGPSLPVAQGPFFLGATGSSIFGSKCAYMGSEANTNEDGGNHTYVYQSIGIYDGEPPVVDIELDWGLAPGKTGGQMGVTVMILESDGTFVPNEWEGQAGEIYGKPGITEIGRGSALRVAATGVVMHERFQIDLTGATIGNELFLRFNNFEAEGGVIAYVQVDNITMSPAYVVNLSPADGAEYIPVWRTASQNDLVFDIVDASITAVDVLFGAENDPNLSVKPELKIVEGMPVTLGQNTVTLETELTTDLRYSTDYYWKVLAYEPNGMELDLKYTGLITSFKTIQEGPYLVGVDPSVAGVWPGENAVFTVPFSVSADTLQWYKEGNPDIELEDTEGVYAGTDSNSLTIINVQPEDEGTYYCVGTETATGLTSATLSPGQLFIKELKAHYPFETTYTVGSDTFTPDIIGGKDMQLMGGASVGGTDANSIFGGYLALNNPRDVTHTEYADIEDASVAHYPDITVSCWVKPTILDLDFERFARIFDFGQDAENYFFLTLLYQTNQAYCEMVLDGDNRDTANSDEAVYGDEIGYGTQWLYVVLTIAEEEEEDEDGEITTTTMGKIYINGQYTIGDGIYHPSEIPMTLAYIGKAINETDTPPNFDGLIDEFKIYNYAKTAEEIAQEYMEVRTNVEFICNMDTYDLADWDYNGNCRVDLLDLAEIAEKWLLDYLVYFD